MAYTPLTQQGKNFIRKVCEGTGNSLLVGKSKYKINDTTSDNYNPDGVLPYCYPQPSPTKDWYSNAKFDNKPITSNQQLGEAIINWYDKYGKIYEMDANILAAQAYAESAYIVWNYPLTSTASGISQFTSATVFEMIISNKYNIEPKFTQEEINAITKNVTGNTSSKDTFSVGNMTGKKNRPIMHQNITDNPEIMIKAQFRYMKLISNRCNGMASSTLFGYSRGPFGHAFPSYTKSIASATNSADYQIEGIGYVYKIFSLLGNNNYHPKGYFGYDQLKMHDTFDKYKAEIDESNLM